MLELGVEVPTALHHKLFRGGTEGGEPNVVGTARVVRVSRNFGPRLRFNRYPRILIFCPLNPSPRHLSRRYWWFSPLQT